MLPTTLLSLLLLSAGALSLPTNTSSSTSDLDKRSSWGWVGSYSAKNCKGKQIGPRPKIRNDCIKFQPASDIVGINWGSWPIGLTELDVYSDEHCTVFAGASIKAPDFSSTDGVDTCVSVKAHGAKWGSVRNHAMSPDSD